MQPSPCPSLAWPALQALLPLALASASASALALALLQDGRLSIQLGPFALGHTKKAQKGKGSH